MATIIDLILNAKNNASPQIKQLRADVESLDKSIGQLSSVASAGMGLAGLAAAIGTIQQVGQAIAETSQAGAQFTRLSGSFDSLASSFGASGTEIVSSIESVTQGTLSQATIMQQANNAMLLGVADTADEFETLAKIAVDRGRAMGISMEYAFESIVKGVGRLSPLILDNLGIVLDADKTYKDYAISIGKTADALSDAEKRQALLARLKEEVSDFDSTAVMDGAAAWERFAASITNAVATAGEWLNSNTMIMSSLKNLSDTLDIMAGEMSNNDSVRLRGLEAEKRRLQEMLELQQEHQRVVEGAQDGGVWNAFDNTEQNIKDTQKALAGVAQEMRNINAEAINANYVKDMFGGGQMAQQAAELQQMEAEIGKISDAMVSKYAKAQGISTEKARENITILVEQRGSWAATIPTINSVVAAFEAAAARMAAINSLIAGSISSIQSSALQAYSDSGYNPAIVEQFQAVNSQAEALRSTVETMDPVEASFYMRQFTDQASEGFKAVSEYANQSTKSIGGAGSATKSLTKEFTNLSGIVSGLVDTAMSDFGGADLAEFLPYQDAPAEDARRIASVMVEGWDSEWADYFKTKFPDLFSKYMGLAGGDIQKASALLLKDFQDGMNPELLDKGKIKEMAKRLFLADEATSKMVDEIARDLASEMGISIEQATAAVGGAAGVKKKPMTKEEVEKLFGGIDMAPKWNMTDSKAKFQEAGKKAGILNDDGDLLVPVKVQFTSMENNVIEGDYKIQITGFVFKDATDFKSTLEASLSSVTIGFSPNPSTEFYTGIQTNIYDYIANKVAAVKIVPAAYDPTVFDNWVAGVENFITGIDININPTMSTDTFEAVFGPIRTALKDTFITQETADVMVFNLAAALGLGILNNIEGFNWQGKFIGNLIINNFEEANVGQLLANSLSNQLTQAQRTFELSAAASGKVWGNAFLSTVQANVPVELINILTDLVTPQVAKKTEDKKGRGSAE